MRDLTLAEGLALYFLVAPAVVLAGVLLAGMVYELRHRLRRTAGWCLYAGREAGWEWWHNLAYRRRQAERSKVWRELRREDEADRALTAALEEWGWR